MNINYNFFNKKSLTSNSFLNSIFAGIFLWFIFFLITPFEVINSISSKTIWYILINYLSLIMGYFFSHYLLFKKSILNPIQIKPNPFFIITLLLVLFSSVIRCLDLFLIRDASIFENTLTNSFNITKDENFSLIFGLGGVFRLLYFVPFVLYILLKKRNKRLLFVCLFLFLVPVLEGYLRGSRRLIFEPIALLVIIMFLNKINKSLSKIIKIVTILGVVFLLTISNFILKEREEENNEKYFLEKIYKAPYNEFIPLKEKTKIYILKNSNNYKGSLTFMFSHVGQYIVHGIYEFEHLQQKQSPKRLGMYNGFIIIKLLNKLKLSEISLNELMNPTKRVTYITFFGGLFIDFGWYSIFFMFVFGILQNYFLVLSRRSYVFKPIVIVFTFTNIFLLIFNFMRAQMYLVILIYLILILSYNLYFKIKKI